MKFEDVDSDNSESDHENEKDVDDFEAKNSVSMC